MQYYQSSRVTTVAWTKSGIPVIHTKQNAPCNIAERVFLFYFRE